MTVYRKWGDYCFLRSVHTTKAKKKIKNHESSIYWRTKSDRNYKAIAVPPSVNIELGKDMGDNTQSGYCNYITSDGKHYRVWAKVPKEQTPKEGKILKRLYITEQDNGKALIETFFEDGEKSKITVSDFKRTK